VPTRKPGSEPVKPIGGSVPASRSCSSGSRGAISGANTASTIKIKMNPPAKTTLGCASNARMRLRPACRDAAIAPGASSDASAMAQFRVESRDADVDCEIDQHEQPAKHQHQALNKRKVAIYHRVNRHRADPRIGKD